MESAADKKSRYVSALLEAHPVYLPDTFVSQSTATALKRLPEQALFWLYLLVDRQTEAFKDLWLCYEEMRDGENEYGCDFFVRAANEEEARIKAWHYVHRNYDYDDHQNEKPYEEYLNEVGWMELDYDYRWARVSRIRKVNSLKDILDHIGCVTFGIEDTPEGKH
jgi:hypothetical protein